MGTLILDHPGVSKEGSRGTVGFEERTDLSDDTRTKGGEKGCQEQYERELNDKRLTPSLTTGK